MNVSSCARYGLFVLTVMMLVRCAGAADKRPAGEDQRKALCADAAAKVATARDMDERLRLLKVMEEFGKEECVSALAQMLRDQDPPVRAAALAALQVNPSPGATARILEALNGLSKDSPAPAEFQVNKWPERAGLVNALGARRDPAAAAALAALLADADAEVAVAAAAALGEIGNADALKALKSASVAKDKPDVRAAALNGRLAAANYALAAGRAAEAAAMFGEICADASAPDCPWIARVSALRGQVMADKEKALPAVLKAMADGNEHVAVAAAGAAAELPVTPELTKALSEALGKSSPAVQTALLVSLSQRGDRGAAESIAALAKQDGPLKFRATMALAELNDARGVSLLANILAPLQKKKDNEDALSDQTRARAALAGMQGESVDAAFVEALKDSQPAAKKELLKALALRGLSGGAAAVMSMAADPDAGVRAECYRVLKASATAKEIPELLSLVLAEKDADTALPEAVSMAGAVCRKAKDADAVLASLARASMPAKGSLYRVLANVAGEKALQAIRAGVKAGDAAERDAAVRALADVWPDRTAMPDLLQLAGSAEQEALKILSLRGYIRMARMDNKRPSEERCREALAALPLAKRPEEKRLVVSALAEAGGAQAVKALIDLLTDAAVKTEAAQATLQVAESLAKSAPADAQAAVMKVSETAGDASTRKRAEELLKTFQKK